MTSAQILLAFEKALQADHGHIHRLALSPSGSELAVAYSDANVLVWNIQTGEAAGPVRHEGLFTLLGSYRLLAVRRSVLLAAEGRQAHRMEIPKTWDGGLAKGCQGDGPGALEAYLKSLGIAEALATRDPANTGWQTDLVASFAKLGMT